MAALEELVNSQHADLVSLCLSVSEYDPTSQFAPEPQPARLTGNIQMHPVRVVTFSRGTFADPEEAPDCFDGGEAPRIQFLQAALLGRSKLNLLHSHGRAPRTPSHSK
jgi:hypothetical protein